MKTSIYWHLLPWKLANSSSFHGNNNLYSSTSMYSDGSWKLASFHGGSSSLRLGFGLGLGSVLWKQLEVYDTRESRWKYVGVCGSSWKLPRNIFVEGAIDGSNGRFNFHRQRKLPCTSMEAFTNFHGSKPTVPPTSMGISMEFRSKSCLLYTSPSPRD